MKLSKNVKNSNFPPSLPNSSNRILYECSYSKDENNVDTSTNYFTYPIAQISKEAKFVVLWIRWRTLIDSELYGSLVIVKFGSKGNKFVVELISNLHKIDQVLEKSILAIIYRKISGYFLICADRTMRHIAFSCT